MTTQELPKPNSKTTPAPALPSSSAEHPRSSRAILTAYLPAALLQCCVMAIIAFCDARYRQVFPWASMSLLMVAVSAHLWGRGPALMTLLSAAIFGDLVIHDQHISWMASHTTIAIKVIRTALFIACGGIIIGLSERMRFMNRSAEQRRTVLESLQQMILPPRLPSPKGWDTAWHYQPSSREDEVGGDFYDLFPLENGDYGVIVGDVMGKGKEAAMHTAYLRYTLRAYLAIGWPPSQALAQVDRTMAVEWADETTASVFVGRLDPTSGRLTYANAGHEAPMTGIPGKPPVELRATGPILGTGIGFGYDEETVYLKPNESLLLFTDGVTEARNPEGDFLDSHGVWRLFTESAHARRQDEVLSDVVKSLIEYTEGVQHDDVAMVLLKRRESRKSSPRSDNHAVP